MVRVGGLVRPVALSAPRASVAPGAHTRSRTHSFVFHTANAWEDGDEVVLLACRNPTMDLNMEIINRPKLYEWRFNLRDGSVTERHLDTERWCVGSPPLCLSLLSFCFSLSLSCDMHLLSTTL